MPHNAYGVDSDTDNRVVRGYSLWSEYMMILAFFAVFELGVVTGAFVLGLCQANSKECTPKADPINTVYDYGR